ncbi:hypothetical protein FIBSPDRAFT_873396 [Athelia psychrophila]|uniref:Uncharacterized protein n=1 Tax=Athelia psychrophila TaxID=1759441 RepID=A0A165YMD5_9AGAM|nr:hypothetical protein FIBSPDRAFT_873396 [Fibularhizoctonia sp. CBS 109695]
MPMLELMGWGWALTLLNYGDEWRAHRDSQSKGSTPGDPQIQPRLHPKCARSPAPSSRKS